MKKSYKIKLTKANKAKLKKYSRTLGVLALGVALGFSTARFNTVGPQEAVAETPKLEVSQIQEKKKISATSPSLSKSKSVANKTGLSAKAGKQKKKVTKKVSTKNRKSTKLNKRSKKKRS